MDYATALQQGSGAGARGRATPVPIPGISPEERMDRMKAVGLGALDLFGLPSAAAGAIGGPEWQEAISGPQERHPEGAIAGALLSSGPMNSIVNGVGRGAASAWRAVRSAPKMSAALLASLGLTAAPAEAGENTTDDPLPNLIAQKATLDQRRMAATSARDAEGRSGKGPKWQSANDEVTRIDNQIGALDQMIAEEQHKRSPEYRLQMQEKQRASDEQAKRDELDKPFASRHPNFATGLAIGAPIASAVTARYGLGKIASKGTSLMADVLKARKAGDVPGMEEALAKADQWRRWVLPKQAAAIAVPATFPADARVTGDVIDRYALPDTSKAQQRAEAKLSDVPQYFKDAIPGIAQGLVWSAIGAKTAGAAPRGDAAAMGKLYGDKSTADLASILKQGDAASAGVVANRRALRSGSGATSETPRVGPPEGTPPAIAASPTSMSAALQEASPTDLGSPTTLPGTSVANTGGSAAAASSSPSPSSARPRGGSHPDHNWNPKSNRWHDVNGQFLSGPAPKD